MGEEVIDMCQHYWKFNSPAHGEHLIGTCRYCGEDRDFTIIQENDKGWIQICLANTLTRPKVTMSTIMAVKKPRGKQSTYSRGRVR